MQLELIQTMLQRYFTYDQHRNKCHHFIREPGLARVIKETFQRRNVIMDKEWQLKHQDPGYNQ